MMRSSFSTWSFLRTVLICLLQVLLYPGHATTATIETDSSASSTRARLSTEPSSNPLYAMDTAVRRLPPSLNDRVTTLAALGYAGFSWNGSEVGGIRKAIAAADARGLKLYGLYLACPLTSQTIELPPHYDAICEALKDSGCVLWLYMESKHFKPGAQEGFSIAVPGLRNAADRAAKHGVPVAFYHHHSNWIESFEDALRLAELVDRPNFGVSFNLCHSLRAGEEGQLSELLRRAGRRLFMVTINGADSNAANGGWDRLIQPIGQGTFDLKKLLVELKEVGYHGPIGFQAFGIKSDPLQCLEDSMREWRLIKSVAMQESLERQPSADSSDRR